MAGLSAASVLVGRGLKITLIESRPRLGGRASSFIDPAINEPVDNCQHVSMCCCTNLTDFCRRVGTKDLFRRDQTVVFLGPDGRVSTLSPGLFPAPFHLAESFLRSHYLRWTDKLRVAYGLACLVLDRSQRPGESFGDWLLRHGQNVRSINLYWSTVLVSALNERLDQMDVSHARKVFIDGFLLNPEGYQLEIPLVPLGELYGTKMEAWLREHDVTVRLTTGVSHVDLDPEHSLTGLTLRSGESLKADFVILTVPFDRVRGLIPSAFAERIPALAQADALTSSPITGVHLWFDREVCPFDHVVTVGRVIQWVFNHSAIQGRGTSEQGGQYLQLVISASYDLLALDNHAIRDLVLKELAEIWPAARDAELLRWRVVTEHGATFAVRPGVEQNRPSQRTPIEGLFLAGDWTDTGWPATMEGAVRSGYLAVEGILEDLGRPVSLIQPGLPTSWLSRRLVRRPREDRPRGGKASASPLVRSWEKPPSPRSDSVAP